VIYASYTPYTLYDIILHNTVASGISQKGL